MKLKLLSALSSVFWLALALMIVLVAGTSAAAAQTSPTTQLGFLLDGSGSIENPVNGGKDGNWETIVNGIGGALRDPACVPQDGSIEFTLVVFANAANEDVNPRTGIKIPPTIIADQRTADLVGGKVEALLFPSPGINGETPPELGGTETAEALMVIADTMAGSDNFSAAHKQAINLVTDGLPYNVDEEKSPEGCVVDPGLTNNFAKSQALTVCARDYLIETLQMTEDQDELDSEFIVPAFQPSPTDPVEWLRDDVVYPQPGSFANLETDTFDAGWVLVVGDVAEFSDAICRKFQITFPDVTVFKQVTGSNAPANEIFDVTLTCGDKSETFKLKDGESGTLMDIRPGTVCSATESDPGSDWEVTLPPTLTVTQDGSNNLTVTNEYFEPKDVTVSKQVTGSNAPANEIFDVTLTCGDTSETFELKDGESGTLKAIAPGTVCSATESDPGSDWEVTLPPTLTVTQDGSNNLTVTNEYFEPKDVTVSKQVTGSNAPANEIFDVTLTCGDSSETFELKDGESGTLEAIQPGTICSATESDPGSDWTVTLPPTLTVTLDGSNNLTVTNEYNPGGPKVYITESYAVTDLDEDGSPHGMACYWITLATEPQGPVTVNMTFDDSQITLDKRSVVLDAANWDALDLASSNKICVFPNQDDTYDATGIYCAGMSETLFGQASADQEVCGDQLSLIAHSIDESSAPPYDQSNIQYENLNGPDLDGNQATVDVLLRDQFGTATVDVAHYAPFAEDVAETSVTVRITGDGVDVALENFKYGDEARGNLLPAGLELTIQLLPTGSDTPALVGAYTLEAGVSYTLAAIGGANGWELVLLPLVNETTPPAGGALVRIGHLAPFADADTPGSTAVDVCTDSGAIVVENIEYPEVEDYLALPAGTYDLLLAAAGANCGEAILDLSPLSLDDGDIVDVFIIGLAPDDPNFSLQAASLESEIESAAGIYLPMINGQ